MHIHAGHSVWGVEGVDAAGIQCSSIFPPASRLWPCRCQTKAQFHFLLASETLSATGFFQQYQCLIFCVVLCTYMMITHICLMMCSLSSWYDIISNQFMLYYIISCYSIICFIFDYAMCIILGVVYRFHLAWYIDTLQYLWYSRIPWGTSMTWRSCLQRSLSRSMKWSTPSLQTTECQISSWESVTCNMWVRSGRLHSNLSFAISSSDVFLWPLWS